MAPHDRRPLSWLSAVRRFAPLVVFALAPCDLGCSGSSPDDPGGMNPSGGAAPGSGGTLSGAGGQTSDGGSGGTGGGLGSGGDGGTGGETLTGGTGGATTGGTGGSSDTTPTFERFKGVNWADSRDNFQAGVLYISGLSSTDTYDSALATGTAIMNQFVSKLGANSVRMPINEATVSQYWSTYTGAIDGVLTKGKVVLGYWDSHKDNRPPDMNAWWAMWKTVTDKYGSNENVYFEVFNEPNMYDKTELGDLYYSWLTHFPAIPHGRVILDGTGNAQNVPDIGSDERLKDCLLAVHDYSFFGGESMINESDWENHIKGSVGSYAARTICTEWGGPMSPGSKNGKNYDSLDYSKPPTNYFEGYIRGISNQLRTWEMGSFYWPGLRDGDWYSMTIKDGSGADITLTIPNQSGLDRLQHAWGME